MKLGLLIVVLVVGLLAWELYMQANAPGPSPDPVNNAYPAGVVAMAQAIQQFEGWYPGSHAYRNNNPGNLDYPEPGAVGADSSGFAKFASVDDGWKALCDYIVRHANGDGGMGPQTTIAQFFAIYAPTGDTRGNNNPSQYAAFVAQKVGAALGMGGDPNSITLGDVNA